jgi:hypothetical protein
VSNSDPLISEVEWKQGLIPVKPLAMALLSVKTWSFWGECAGVPFFKTHTKIFKTGLHRTEEQPKDSYFFESKGERWHRLGNQLELPHYRMSSSHWGHKTTFGSPAAWADYGAPIVERCWACICFPRTRHGLWSSTLTKKRGAR